MIPYQSWTMAIIRETTRSEKRVYQRLVLERMTDDECKEMVRLTLLSEIRRISNALGLTL